MLLRLLELHLIACQFQQVILSADPMVEEIRLSLLLLSWFYLHPISGAGVNTPLF